MSLINDIPKFKKLDRLIRHGVTGTPDDLAKKMNVSRATIFKLIARLKEDFEAPIYFDRNGLKDKKEAENAFNSLKMLSLQKK